VPVSECLKIQIFSDCAHLLSNMVIWCGPSQDTKFPLALLTTLSATLASVLPLSSLHTTFKIHWLLTVNPRASFSPDGHLM